MKNIHSYHNLISKLTMDLLFQVTSKIYNFWAKLYKYWLLIKELKIII